MYFLYRLTDNQPAPTMADTAAEATSDDLGDPPDFDMEYDDGFWADLPELPKPTGVTLITPDDEHW